MNCALPVLRSAAPCARSEGLFRVVGFRLVEPVLDRSRVDHLQLAACNLRNELPAEALMCLAVELLFALRMLFSFGEGGNALNRFDECVAVARPFVAARLDGLLD